MSPELQAHLLDIGTRLIAAERLAGLALAIIGRIDPAVIEANIRVTRLKAQEVRLAGRDASALELELAALGAARDGAGVVPAPSVRR